MEEIRQNPAFMNTTVLAYMGDAIYEVFVREYVIGQGQVHADKLHHTTVHYVCAGAQAEAIKELLPRLTEEELGVVKRGRNKKITSKPKNADPMTYKWATAYEALLGYLHLSGQEARKEELLKSTIELISAGMRKEK